MKRILLVLFFVPSVALAQADGTDIRYSWFQLGHVMSTAEVPGEDLDLSGWNFSVSFAVRDHVHLFADYESFEVDDFEEVTGNETTLGIGAHFDLVERFSIFGRVGYYDVSADDGLVAAEDDGIRAIAGVRFIPLPGYELRGGVDYVDLDLAGDDTAGFAAADIWLSDGFALTAEVLSYDSGESYMVGGRFYFGN